MGALTGLFPVINFFSVGILAIEFEAALSSVKTRGDRDVFEGGGTLAFHGGGMFVSCLGRCRSTSDLELVMRLRGGTKRRLFLLNCVMMLRPSGTEWSASRRSFSRLDWLGGESVSDLLVASPTGSMVGWRAMFAQAFVLNRQQRNYYRIAFFWDLLHTCSVNSLLFNNDLYFLYTKIKFKSSILHDVIWICSQLLLLGLGF